MKILAIFIAIHLLLIQSVFSQKLKEDTMHYDLPTEILITAPRLNLQLRENPVATSVVTFNNMENTMPKTISVDEALKLVPGLKIDNQWNGENVHLSIRGEGILSERGIRGAEVLLDGIPLTDPGGFAPDFYDVDWESVSRVEILRGPSGSIYGGNGSAGVINIMTQDYTGTPLTGNAFLSYGSHNFWKGFGQFGGEVKNVNYRVSLSRMASDGYRQHTNYWANNIYGKATIKVSSNFQISPVIGYTEFHNDNPEGLDTNLYKQDPTQSNPDAATFNEFQQTQRFFAGLTGQLNITPQHQINFNAYGRRTIYTEAFPDQVSHSTFVNPGGSVQYTFSAGKPKSKIKNKFSIGGDYQSQNIDQYAHPNLGAAVEDYTTFLSKETISQKSYGGFVLDRIEFGPKWSVMVSARYDQINNNLGDSLAIDSINHPINLSGSKNYNKATGKIGITFLPNKNLSIFANFGTGFLPPSINELGSNPDAFGGFNQHLVPATSSGGEVGFRDAYKDKLYVDLTGFYLMTTNDFDRFRVPDRPLETFYNNAGSSRRIGAELYTSWKPVKILKIQVAYTYSNFKYTNISTPIQVQMTDTTDVRLIQNGNYLPNSPQHQLMTDIEFYPVPALTIGIGSETYSKWYVDGSDYVDPLGLTNGYTLFNAKASYKFKIAKTNAEISFYAKNVLGKKYIAFSEPDPDGFSYHPGPVAEFFGSLRVGF